MSTEYVHAAGCNRELDWQGNHEGPCASLSEQLREMVDHPQHYGGADDPYEVIKVLEAWLTSEQMSGFCLGNSMKYLGRAGKKDDRTQDLKKARWYLDYEIERNKD